MIATFLTGEAGADYQMLGVQAAPVTDYSPQIQALLCLRGMQHAADCFAIPLRGHGSEGIQWHSPRSGAVVRWQDAGDAERRAALQILEQAVSSLQQLAEQCLAADNPPAVFFGRLLQKMMIFPGKETVFLVNNLPVITFWGHCPQQPAAAGSPPLHSLAGALLSLSPDGEHFTTDRPVLPVTAEVPARQTGNNSRAAITGGVLAALILAVAVSGYMWRYQRPSSQPPAAITEQRLVTTSVKPLSVARLPLQLASIIAAGVKPVAAPPPVTRHRLQIPAASVKRGDVSFMDGEWQAVIHPPQSQPLSLQFTFGQGRGHLQMVSAVHGRCQAAVSRGFLPSGTLSLYSRFRAACQDGSRMQVPAVLCTLTTRGTDCTASLKGQPVPRTITLFSTGHA
ncbi:MULTISPECIES: hypothetical protein [unclassified Tatumella]|uniref:hypothetical protein n=1 Tax=unclassified Tatumella TaxID=2649542 RepID=UPI001BB0A535|nr:MULTISPECIES: hypothetical protein [unclassified Tatumella]MBS0876106.1 hypothetical protein [Tatumella sp. JGM82]MBS0889154.1 hypothetical protein [Tatumella sp. JGM94]MBS0892693.1 hypothetical protein [Tatumella sp. JGM130]MBS0901036.1 hypothetical protein [Tatumella sp. JGM100]